jgi:acetyl esterase/lipase
MRATRRTPIRYGQHHAQVAEVWRPAVLDDANLPVVALIHGGFWRQLYTKRLMHRMAGAIAAHGWVAFNIEYRRVGRFGGGGWPATSTTSPLRSTRSTR